MIHRFLSKVGQKVMVLVAEMFLLVGTGWLTESRTHDQVTLSSCVLLMLVPFFLASDIPDRLMQPFLVFSYGLSAIRLVGHYVIVGHRDHLPLVTPEALVLCAVGLCLYIHLFWFAYRIGVERRAEAGRASHA